MYALFQLLSKTETVGGRLSRYFEEHPPSLKTASRIEQYRWGLPQMKVALRALLSGGLEDPQYTEAGRANIKNFLSAASPSLAFGRSII